MKISIELPFFPGFYESDYENSDTAYCAIREELDNFYHTEDGNRPELTEDDLDFDTEAYENDVIDAFVEVFSNYTPDMVESVDFDEMTRPREYNFRTDRIFAYVTLKDDWMDEVREFMVNNADWLRNQIKSEFTSYDGYISFMSNNFDNTARDEEEDPYGLIEKSWYFHLFSNQSDRFECYLSTIIKYMMYKQNKDVYHDILISVFEEVYDGAYVYVIADREKESEESGK